MVDDNTNKTIEACIPISTDTPVRTSCCEVSSLALITTATFIS
ncbi:hypothetical protein JMJ77_0003501 [Colletotrichum scovillei]|uniref:Uncharacterized protein n=1 Tax=Colletotrichum scovillei TaxID=1209932 RepID=A0A9P7U6E8_9PEZI|nr:hypothetical protein JMJ78_0005006 [Colletotrichum scovillei]KAG7041395.1 hypothetical protein JMJ77_0003501 [Colletotrichum scovillei]KAG7061422.1 hypothetical protein JMJ76_0000986 [Colletotrichum scovillei]